MQQQDDVISVVTIGTVINILKSMREIAQCRKEKDGFPSM